jgi:hypothetical protein
VATWTICAHAVRRENEVLRKVSIWSSENRTVSLNNFYRVVVGVATGDGKFDEVGRYDGSTDVLEGNVVRDLTGSRSVDRRLKDGESLVARITSTGSPALTATGLTVEWTMALAGGNSQAEKPLFQTAGFVPDQITRTTVDGVVRTLNTSGITEWTVPVTLADPAEEAVEPEQEYPLTLDNDGSTVDVASTNAETTLYTYDLPADTLVNGRAVKLWLHGDALGNTGLNTLIVRVKLGGTTIYQDVTGTWANSATRRPWLMEFVVGASDSSSAQSLGGGIHIGSVGTATTGLGDLAGATVAISDTPVFGTASKDGTTVLALAVTVQWSASSASLSFRKYQASVVWL